MEFLISKKELDRRKRAFGTLLVSLAVGIFLFSNLINFPVPSAGLLIISVIFLIIFATTSRYLASLSQLKIRILDWTIERQKGTHYEKYSISEIDSLKIKRRTDGTIREIYISFRNCKHLYINAFEEKFELLKDTLLGQINNKIFVKEIHESIHFDHVLFYPILGLLISFLSIFFLRQILRADYSSIRIILLFFSAYTFFLAIFFLLKKPISLGSGRDQLIIDYVFGVSMLLVSIVMVMMGLQPRF